jgi:hypothetical protein
MAELPAHNRIILGSIPSARTEQVLRDRLEGFQLGLISQRGWFESTSRNHIAHVAHW